MNETLGEYIEAIPDFPSPGVVFRDISPLLREKLSDAMQAMLALHPKSLMQEVDYFVGLDARGFIFAPAMAALSGKGFVMARKSGKLPEPLFRKRYQLEYGEASLDIKPGSGNVILVDDVLATGGTLKTAADLCAEAGYTVRGFSVLIDLRFLNSFKWNGFKVESVIQYES
jgi:adenine phosphoribosyltransferase